jgi:centromeric protein E
LRVSYLEIYNEKLYDLLPPIADIHPSAPQHELRIREKTNGEVYVENLREELVSDASGIFDILVKAQGN